MKRITHKIFLLSFLFLASYTSVLSQNNGGQKKIRTIVIDPGHGGLDQGAPGMFSTEAQVSLAVSLKLGKAIEKEFPHIKLVFTRTTDVLPGNAPNKDAALKHRAKLANESGADLFIAVHCNAAGKKPGGWNERKVVRYEYVDKKVKVKGKYVTKKVKTPVYENVWVENKAKGTETYIWAVNKNDAKVNALAKNHEYYGEIDSTSILELPDPNDPVERARMLVYTQHYFRKSLNFATWMEEEFVKSGRVSRGVKQRNDKGIWVLQATGMPSVLIEIGFITNKEEEIYINSESGQDTIVNNIIGALRKYIQSVEGTGTSTQTDATSQPKKEA